MPQVTFSPFVIPRAFRPEESAFRAESPDGVRAT